MPTYTINPQWAAPLPPKIRRRGLQYIPQQRRLCRDNRAYFTVPYTFQGDLTVGDYAPMWRVDRDYWIAKLTANVGKHDGTHPADGTPSGTPIKMNFRRVTADLTGDAAILTSDDQLNIAIDHHQDAVNANEDGEYIESDFAVTKLFEGQHVYLRVGQIGSGRPGTDLVASLVLVPVR